MVSRWVWCLSRVLRHAGQSVAAAKKSSGVSNEYFVWQYALDVADVVSNTARKKSVGIRNGPPWIHCFFSAFNRF